MSRSTFRTVVNCALAALFGACLGFFGFGLSTYQYWVLFTIYCAAWMFNRWMAD